MKFFRSTLGLALLLASSLAFAINANYTPQVGLIVDGGTTNNVASVNSDGSLVISTESKKATYSVVVTAATPAATTTDLANITGSATKTIKVTRVTVSGMATTAGSMDVSLVLRSAVDTAGTCVSQTAIALDSAQAAATSVVQACSANPTLGTIVGAVADQKLNFGLTGATGTVIFDFGATRPSRAPTLRGAANQLAINLNGQAVPSGGTASYTIEWTEE